MDVARVRNETLTGSTRDGRRLLCLVSVFTVGRFSCGRHAEDRGTFRALSRRRARGFVLGQRPRAYSRVGPWGKRPGCPNPPPAPSRPLPAPPAPSNLHVCSLDDMVASLATHVGATNLAYAGPGRFSFGKYTSVRPCAYSRNIIVKSNNRRVHRY